MLTVQTFLEGFLTKWETPKHSLDTDDSGNYFKGSLVGSKFGVTGAALAKHRGVKSVTKEDVASVTLAEAASIARTTYYDEAQFDMLPWGPVVASAVDKCYMSGEDAAVKCIQRACGTNDDGHIGEKTVLAVAKASQDQVSFAERMAKERMNHEALVIKAKPVKAKYRKGWNNRTNSYMPGTSWWKSWELGTPAAPALDLTAYPQAADFSHPQDSVSETAAANVKELAKSLSRNEVTDVLDRAPSSVVEHVTEAAKLKLGEKSTWIGAAVVAASVAADPTVQAALKPTLAAIKSGSFGGILTAVIGLGLVIARSRSTPRTDAVIAAKRIADGA